MAENERIDVTTSDVVALRECRAKYELSSLNLKNSKSKKEELSSNAFAALKTAIINGEDISSSMKKFTDTCMEKEWYDYEFSYESAKERVHALYTRLGEYLVDSIGKDIVSYDIQLSYPFGINYYKVPIRNIKTNADMIIKRDGYIEAIILSSGISTVSKAARKPENLPENDLAISVMYAAMRQLYPDDIIKVSVYYLSSKDDKGTNYVLYEYREGKNIASATFDTSVDALQHLKHVMCIRKEKQCQFCHQIDCCQISPFVNEIQEKTESTSNGKKFNLTPAQEEIVNHIDGPMLVEAAPGTGKTASLVNRLLNMINKGIDPKSILMITFTKKARAEIENRVSNLLGNETVMPEIQTFNGCGYNILRDNPNILGELRLAEDFDKKSLIERALSDCVKEGIVIKGVNYSDMRSQFGLVNTMYDYFDKLESFGLERFTEIYSSKKDVAGIYSVYSKYKQLFEELNYISYDEQISLVNQLFQNPDVLSAYQQKWRYIMVDEFQDVSLDQFNMIYSLSEQHRNLVCVGDCDQAIYSFRGGSNRFALEFKEYFPDAQIVYMVDNFRCTKPIVEAANTLIKNNVERFDKTIISHKDGVPVLLYRDCFDGENGIYSSLISEGYAPGDIAVIATTNKSLTYFGERIAPDGSLKPKDYVIKDSVFLALLDILDLHENGLDNDRTLYRVLILAGATRNDFLDMKRDTSIPLCICSEIPDLTLKPIENHKDTPLWRAGLKVKSAMREFAYAGKIEDILTNICKDMFGITEHPVINYLVEKCDERCISTTSQLLSLMLAMVTYNDSARVGYKENCERVNLVTAHDSKGKEFPCVIVYGVENFKNDEEGRRLLYVALTRAKEKLVIIESFRKQDSMVNEFNYMCREVLQGRRSHG